MTPLCFKRSTEFGLFHGAMAKDLLPKLRCSVCKARCSAITISPKNTGGGTES